MSSVLDQIFDDPGTLEGTLAPRYEPTEEEKGAWQQLGILLTNPTQISKSKPEGSRKGARFIDRLFKDAIGEDLNNFDAFMSKYGSEKGFELLNQAVDTYPPHLQTQIKDLLSLCKAAINKSEESEDGAFFGINGIEIPETTTAAVEQLKAGDCKAAINFILFFASYCDHELKGNNLPTGLAGTFVLAAARDPQFRPKTLLEGNQETRTALFQKFVIEARQNQCSELRSIAQFISDASGVDLESVLDNLTKLNPDQWPPSLILSRNSQVNDLISRARSNFEQLEKKLSSLMPSDRSGTESDALAAEVALYSYLSVMSTQAQRGQIAEHSKRMFFMGLKTALKNKARLFQQTQSDSSSESRNRPTRAQRKRSLAESDSTELENIDQEPVRKVYKVSKDVVNGWIVTDTSDDVLHMGPNVQHSRAIKAFIEALESLPQGKIAGVKKMHQTRTQIDEQGRPLTVFELKPSEFPGLGGGKGMRDLRAIFTILEGGDIGLFGVTHRSELTRNLVTFGLT